MTDGRALRARIRPGVALAVAVVVAAAATHAFAISETGTLSTVGVFVVASPLLFSLAVRGVRDHPLYDPFAYGCFVAIGLLQYASGAWELLAGGFVASGLVGLGVELRDRSSRRTRTG